jgi:hypothetical protein
MNILIEEGLWMDAQKHGFVPVYHEGYNSLYFEKPGVLITGYRPCGPITESGQQYVRVYDGPRDCYYKTLTLYWHMNYAGDCPKCGEIMVSYESLAYDTLDTEYMVEQCIGCGYYE